MAKKSTATGVGVGGSSILVIFILLCLTTFATLSMVSANADLRLTQKTATAVQEYYAADARAEEILAEIDEVLKTQMLKSSISAPDTYIQDLTAAVADVQAADNGDNTVTVRYTVRMNENQQIAVALRVPVHGLAEPRYTLEQWAVVSTAEWEPESGGFDLWDGGFGQTGGPGLTDGLPPLA